MIDLNINATNEWLKILIDNFAYSKAIVFWRRFSFSRISFLSVLSINYTNIRVSSRRFVQNFNLEAACLLYQWLNAYRMYTFFMYVGNDRRFPFSLALSISHLDHFRGISSRRSPSISPLLVNEKVVDHFFEIDDKKRRRGREGEKRGAENR